MARLNDPILEGTITRVLPDRGFGFIRCEEHSADVFLHASSFYGAPWPPKVGDRVSFSAEAHDRGLRATDCRPV
jgi:cold shock CspA family protein